MNWIWIGVILSLILIELVSLNFTSIWFVISGITSYILLRMGKDYIVQVMVFLILGVSLIIIVRPKIIKYLIKKRDIVLKRMVKKYSFMIHLVPHEIRENIVKD